NPSDRAAFSSTNPCRRIWSRKKAPWQQLSKRGRRKSRKQLRHGYNAISPTQGDLEPCLRFSKLPYFDADNGMWLTLVERLVRDQEAVGSNPTSPINYTGPPHV